jgi:hypothetical protein
LNKNILYSDIDWLIYADFLEDQGLKEANYIREDVLNTENLWYWENYRIGDGDGDGDGVGVGGVVGDGGVVGGGVGGGVGVAGVGVAGVGVAGFVGSWCW